jgi:hypothetical protein
MSTNTISTGTYKDLLNSDTFLDARCAAVLMKAGQEGISGWVFDIPTGESIDLDSDITDHYVESGFFVTDHAVIKPIIITLSGLKGEVLYTGPKKDSVQNALNVATSVLGSVTAYMGPLTAQASQKLSALSNEVSYAAGQAAAIKKRASNLIKYFSGEDASKNLQQKAFLDISSIMRSKQIVTVQTPWNFFGNMMIKTISVNQDQDSNDFTTFSITLKEMRIVDTKTTTFDSGTYASAIDAQSADAANVGQTQGSETKKSTLYSIATPGQSYITADGASHLGIK